MKNNKGFTLVELLGVLTIMGILMMIAVPTLTRTLNKARGVSTDTMLKSSYEAAEEYVAKYNIYLSENDTKTVTIQELVDDNLLEPLVDPKGNSQKCGTGSDSKVVITRPTNSNTKGNLINYTYEVTIICPQTGKLNKKFPE